MKRRILFSMGLMAVIILAACDKNKSIFDAGPSGDRDSAGEDTAKVVYAGVRSSSYGIDPFPDPKGWQTAMETMSGYYAGSRPCAVWIVGEIWGRDCHLYFPSNGRSYPNVSFGDADVHERFFKYFDQTGIKVFLQVESADADPGTLIDLVLGRYKQHSCVAGFGVDVEWYREPDHPGWGEKVGDDSARAWEARVKSHNPNYRLFLKHWDREWMPPTYRGDIVFVDDSQGFSSLNEMIGEFKTWGAFFKPNRVFFQVGYEADQRWWQKLANPAKDVGTAIAAKIDQQCGIFWVDFTLRDVLPTS
jgi:hypothetical protein